jgi:hypothetical protein
MLRSAPTRRARARITAITLIAMGSTLSMLACDEPAAKAVTPVVPPGRAVAYLTVSNAAPAIGDTVFLRAAFDADSSAPHLGSFSARLVFSASGLVFVRAVPSASGMQATRVHGDTLVVAAATSGGVAAGELFAAEFRVVGRAPFDGIRLDLTEATDLQFASALGSIEVQRDLRPARR